MKYKVVVNNVPMGENLSASKAMNLVINIIQANREEDLDVFVFYLASDKTWQLENHVLVQRTFNK